MVATLIRLRWRLTFNALRRSVWIMVAAVIGAAWAAGAIITMVAAAVAFGLHESTAVAATAIGGLGALTVLGWALVPLLLTGVDSTLDPRALAVWIAPSRSLACGLAVAGAAGIPGIVTAVCFLLPALVWALGGRWGAAGLALLLAPAALATCVLLSRVVVIGSGASASRRSRDIVGAVGGVVVIGAGLLPSAVNLVAARAEEPGTAGLMTIGRVLFLSPFGWAFAAPGCLAQGQAVQALVLTLGALASPIALAPAWGRIVGRVMSGGGRVIGRSGRPRRSTGVRGRGSGESASVPEPVTPLPWHRRLSRFLPSPAAAITARCLRYWRTDPRYLVLAVSSIFVVLVLGTVMVLNARHGLPGGGQGQVGFETAPASMALGRAPAGLLGVPVFVALVSGWGIHDDLGYDSTAQWMHLSAGVRGRDDRLGRVSAAVLWQLPLIAVITIGFGAWTGRWDIVPAVVGAQLGLYGAALAWSSVMGAIMPYEVTAPGASPLKSRTSGMTLVASLVQMIGFLAVAVLALPVVAGICALMLLGAWQWGWALLIVGVLWGAGLAWAGVVVGGRTLDQRWLSVLTTVRSWPGHAETR